MGIDYEKYWVVLLIFLMNISEAHAGCKKPAPVPVSFVISDGKSCPSGYSLSGNACKPISSSSHYVFVNYGGSCPSGCFSSGQSCAAISTSSCHAFYSNGGSCPSGYHRSGNSCVSNN